MDSTRAWVDRMCARGRLVFMAEQARGAASADNGFVTGAVIHVDGSFFLGVADLDKA